MFDSVGSIGNNMSNDLHSGSVPPNRGSTLLCKPKGLRYFQTNVLINILIVFREMPPDGTR